MNLNERIRPTRKSNLLIGALVLAAVIGTGVGAFLLGSRHAISTLTIQRVTPDEVASAMQRDIFYSGYGNDTLLIQGTIARSSESQGLVTIDFTTAGDYKAQCQLRPSNAKMNPGASVTIVAEAGRASRSSTGVGFSDCVSAAN